MRQTQWMTALLCCLSVWSCGLKPSAEIKPGGTAARQAATVHASVVSIGYRNREDLERLGRYGIDLFENVNDAIKTVGARISSTQAIQLRQAGYTLRFEQAVAKVQGFPSGYHRVNDISKTLRRLSQDYPSLVHLQVLGTSLERRQVVAVRIGPPNRVKPRVLFYAGEHARELMPVELQLRMIEHLATRYGQDVNVTQLVDEREIWVIPLMNPDGRVRVEAGDGMWRKNARPNLDGSMGVDINRNYDNHWAKANPRPEDEDYRGSSPESEPETQLLKQFMTEQRFTLAVNMPSFAGMILWPPGYDKSFSPKEALLGRVGHAIGRRLAYKSGTIARTIYQVNGDSTTWAMEALGTLAYLVELNDPGFAPPFEQMSRDWDEWRWPLMWMARVAIDPERAETTLPPEPTATQRWPGFKI